MSETAKWRELLGKVMVYTAGSVARADACDALAAEVERIEAASYKDGFVAAGKQIVSAESEWRDRAEAAETALVQTQGWLRDSRERVKAAEAALATASANAGDCGSIHPCCQVLRTLVRR